MHPVKNLHALSFRPSPSFVVTEAVGHLFGDECRERNLAAGGGVVGGFGIAEVAGEALGVELGRH